MSVSENLDSICSPSLLREGGGTRLGGRNKIEQLYDIIEKHNENVNIYTNISEVLFEYFYRTLFWKNFKLNLKLEIDEDWQTLCYEIVEASNCENHVFLNSWFYFLKNQDMEASLRALYRLYFRNREEVWKAWFAKYEQVKLNLLISYLIRPDNVNMDVDITIKEPTNEVLEEVLSTEVFDTRRFLKTLDLKILPYIKTDWLLQLAKCIAPLWYSDNPTHMKYASAYFRLRQDKLKLYYCLNDIRINGLPWFLKETFGSNNLPIASRDWEVNMIDRYTEDEITDIFADKLQASKIFVKKKFQEQDIKFSVVRDLMHNCSKAEMVIRLLSEVLTNELLAD